MKLLLLILVSVFSVSSVAHAGSMQVDCVAGANTLTASLEVEGRKMVGTVEVTGADVDAFATEARGTYIFYKAGEYYADTDLEIIEFWGQSKDQTVGYKSYTDKNGKFVQAVRINNKSYVAQCRIGKQ